jgi:PAS domain S-box-containing protein
MGDPKQHFISKTIAISLLTTIVIISAAFIALSYYQISKRQKIILENRADEYIDIIAGMLEVPLWDLDRENIKTICTYHFHNDWIALVSLTSASGEKLYGRKKKIETKENDLVNRSKDIIHNGEIIGTIKIAITPQRAEEFTKQLLIASTSALFISVLGLIIATGIVARRTKELERTNIRLRQEIDERKQTVSLLKASENQYKILIETTDTGFVIVDDKGRVLDANEKYIHLSGHECFQDIQGRSVTEWTAEYDIERNANAVKKCFEKGHIRNLEIDYTDKMGNTTPIEINAAVVDRKAGIPIIALCRDITRRKKSQELMIQSEKMMSLGGLAAGMAHEINNPLAGMMQNAQVIHNRLTKDLPGNDKIASELGVSMRIIKKFMEKRDILKQLESINQAGIRAAKIVSNMLSFVRKSDSIKSYCNLEELIDNTIELAQNDYDLKKNYDFKQIEITREYDQDFPTIFCEGSKIQQVFFNLVKNASESMSLKKGKTEKPKLIIRLLKSQNMVCIEVEDNGPGMDEDTRKRIFEPFFTTKGPTVGTGLGLSVSYFIIIDDHKGKMEVESVLGKGTKFIIKLPI